MDSHRFSILANVGFEMAWLEAAHCWRTVAHGAAGVARLEERSVDREMRERGREVFAVQRSIADDIVECRGVQSSIELLTGQINWPRIVAAVSMDRVARWWCRKGR